MRIFILFLLKTLTDPWFLGFTAIVIWFSIFTVTDRPRQEKYCEQQWNLCFHSVDGACVEYNKDRCYDKLGKELM